MAGNQAHIFIIFTLVGITIGWIFDIFRILRKTFKTSDFVTYIEDISFWIITGLIIIYSMYVFCNGELRFFMIIGIIMGTIMYLITLSTYVIKISLFLINIIKKIIITPVITIYRLLRKIIFRPIMIICINVRKNILKNVKKSKKHRGIFVKKEKYNSI